MAIFGSSKKEGEQAGASAARIRVAQAAKLAPGKAHDVLLAPWFSEKALIGTDKGSMLRHPAFGQ